MDNGYTNWRNSKSLQNKKRIKLIIKLIIPFFLISVLIFFFGYDKPIFDKTKLAEFTSGFIGILFIIIIISFIKYKTPKYIPLCNKCGNEIKDINKDCIKGKINLIGTIDRTVYEKTSFSIKGKTTYPRGGYSMRNDSLERISESNYEINGSTPVVKKFYIYSIEYKCKKCNEVFCEIKEETLEPKNINN